MRGDYSARNSLVGVDGVPLILILLSFINCLRAIPNPSSQTRISRTAQP